ncbi:MAG: radical SAM protein, partial [Elusimicrobiota bacterium]|nr:radical SAM protein [Elusimicrobiota bacterium]
GGVHATLLPEQTVAHPNVDIVVRGEGDITAVELTNALETGNSLSNVKGITYKNDGDIVSNPNRPFMNLNDAVDLPYHLLKKEYKKQYSLNTTFFYSDSRGCPHRCRYCYNTIYCNSIWRSKSVDKIISELKWIVENYHPENILFLVDNFFVNKKRVEEILKRKIEEGLDFEWWGDCRANYFDNFSDDFLDLLKKSGCKGLNIGAESGSQRVLDFIKKDITINQILNTVEKMKKFDLDTMLFFVIGFPTETLDETYQTLDLIDRINKINKKAESFIAVYTPYPGTSLYDLVVEKYNYKPPQTLEAWSDWLFSSEENITWFTPEYGHFLQSIAQISRFRIIKFGHPSNLKDFAKQILKLPFSIAAKLRWRYREFRYPIEWKIWSAIQKSRGYF